MKRLESKELRNYYYSFLMIVYHQHTSPTPDLDIPTCVCYTFATMNYCFSDTPSSSTLQAFTYTISSARVVISVLL